ncbi:MAG: hypothetical protein KGJ59_08670, partial [Bacteroidota bacterium]|nr:hypothetical protein [Bacteroidota bacterium]
MKQKLSTAFAVFALLLVGLGSQSYAGTYASSLRTSNPDTVHAFDGSFTDGTGVLLWYTLNGPADTVLATVWWNGTAIMAFKADSTGAGSHNFLWDGKDSLGHYVGVGQYAFTVWTYDKGNPDTVWKQVWQNDVYGDHVTNALSSRDMAIVNDPMSPGFGDLFLSESTTYYGYARMIAARSDGSFIGAFGASNFPQGTVNTDPWYLTTAGDHSLYVTSLTLNSIFVFNDSAVVKVIQDTVHFKNPAGIAAHGAPVPTLYLATGRAVIRGTPTAFLDTLFAVDTVGGGPNGGYVRDVAVDDSGYVYISFGPTSGSYAKILHLSPTGVPIDTVTLPGNVTHLQLFYGTSRTTNADDILYARVPGSAGGVFKVNFATKTATKLFTPSTSSSSYHSITVDMFGDIYYANPSAEWVRMYAPPKSGPFTFTSQPHPVNVFAGAATKVMDNFESGVGHFGKSVTYSGSTVGVSSSSTATLNTTDGHLSGQSMQLVLADDPSSHANWEVRFLSGGGTPSNNDSIGATGWVGFWAKTVSAPPGAMVSIGLDDPSDPYTKRAMLRPVINDGAWHLYEWDIADSMQWTAWVVTSGSSKIKGPRVSVDAVWFFAPDGAPNWTVNFDDV